MRQNIRQRYYGIGEWAFYDNRRQSSSAKQCGRDQAKARDKRQVRREIQEQA